MPSSVSGNRCRAAAAIKARSGTPPGLPIRDEAGLADAVREAERKEREAALGAAVREAPVREAAPAALRAATAVKG